MGAEKNFENKIKGFLKEKHCWFVKYWGGGEFTKAGIPDILCCCNGFFIGIEVKAENGKPSDLQLRNLRLIDKANGFAILLYPTDFQAFKDFIHYLWTFDHDEIITKYEYFRERWLNG